MDTIFKLYQTIQSHQLVLAYQGDFTQEITRSILTIAEKKLEASRENALIRRRVFSVMVESLQNLVKHSEQTESEAQPGDAIFLVAREQTHYSVMSGNPVPTNRAGQLRGMLEEINALDYDSLRQRYKKNMQDTTLSDKGGAGLGFMDMARKSGEKLWFKFSPISSSYALFCLKVMIARASDDEVIS